MFAKSLIVSLALAAAAVQADLYISTPPELKQCEEATFVISGASGSVWPFVVDPNNPCGDPLRELNDATGDLKWTPDLPVGTNVMVEIEDEAGNQAWSGALTVQPGSDSSCITSQSSSASSTSSTHVATPSSTKDSGINIQGPGTPDNVANSPKNTTNNATTTGAAPVRLVAVSGATVLTVLSTLALAL